ncbi:MAG: hypothetical protein GQ527_05385 [Bacteroidales bacterium]|nr:hypothetical protein [Bacteroidales bacterium]
MEECTKVLVEYFKDELPKLEENYQWKIPNIDGFHLCGEKGYTPNVELKKYFNELWLKSNPEERFKLSKIVVADWGGVKTNQPETLKYYVDELEKDRPGTPLKGVASYSKIYSITDMNKYAIYDARVAACLNAVQWNYSVKKGVAFNYISGRNKTTGDATKKIGFVHQEPFKIKNLVANGWSRIKRDETYQVYLDILQNCLKLLPTYSLYDLEMVLFANAEKECEKAMTAQLQVS